MHLTTLIDNGADWSDLNVTCINNKGQIAGSGTYNGKACAFLLTPTDFDKPPTSVYVDEGRAYGLLTGNAQVHSEISTPLQATLTPSTSLNLWLGITEFGTANDAKAQPTLENGVANVLARWHLMAPGASPAWDAEFPRVGSSVTIKVNMTTLAASLNILDLLLTYSGSPLTSDDLVSNLDDITTDLAQVSALTKAARHFVPMPKGKAAWLRACAGAAQDLLSLTPADEKLLIDISLIASDGKSALNVKHLEDILKKPVIILKALVDLHDALALTLKTQGDDMKVIFVGTP